MPVNDSLRDSSAGNGIVIQHAETPALDRRAGVRIPEELGTDSPNLDLLRATAVFCVVLSHVAVFEGRAYLGPLNLQGLGIFGVLIFFVHTCLVLMLSLER